MTVVDMRGRVDELADGTGGSVDAVTGAAIGPYRESRFICGHLHERHVRIVVGTVRPGPNGRRLSRPRLLRSRAWRRGKIVLQCACDEFRPE